MKSIDCCYCLFCSKQLSVVDSQKVISYTLCCLDCIDIGGIIIIMYKLLDNYIDGTCFYCWHVISIDRE